MSDYEKMKKSKFKEWDKVIDDNLDSWVDSFSEMMRRRENWDVNFDEYLEVSMFKLEFKDMIDESLAQYNKEYPESDIGYDAFAYNLLQVSKEEADEFMNTQGGQA